VLGRWIERHTSRDYFRAMLEHIDHDSNASAQQRQTRSQQQQQQQQQHRRSVHRIESYILHAIHRQWDALCPLFLQRLTFTPQWNRRSQNELKKHVAYWRSRNDPDAVSLSLSFKAENGRGFISLGHRVINTGDASNFKKLAMGALVTIGSFSSTTPHFLLNLLTVFSGSISFGLSMSLQTMETCRESTGANNTRSILKSMNLVNVVILAFLVGQLVGSSGGVLFLAEFVVTSVSLILGGAGTISASAMESWATFFCLSATCFWGYLFGRVAVMEGIREKRSGFSSVMLCASLAIMLVVWGAMLFLHDWENPVSVLISRNGEWKNNARSWFTQRQDDTLSPRSYH